MPGAGCSRVKTGFVGMTSKMSTTKYAIIIRIGESIPTPDRVREAWTAVREILNEISEGQMQMMFSTPDGSTAGFFVEVPSAASAHAIMQGLTGKNNLHKGDTIVRNDDSIIVFEVGSDFSGSGFSRAWSWLQHH